MTTMSQRTGVPRIRFDATPYTIENWTILRPPEKASGKLPSVVKERTRVKDSWRAH